METPSSKILLEMVLGTEPEQPELIARAKSIIEADKALGPEDRLKIDQALAELPATPTARVITEMFNENQDDYKESGIGLAFISILKFAISFMKTGGAGRPVNSEGLKSHCKSSHLSH